MKDVCIVNGSLRGEKAASLRFLRDLSLSLPDAEYRKTLVTVKARVRDSYPAETLGCLARADAIVLVFPLHNYGLPGALMRLLEDYHRYAASGGDRRRGTRVYAIVNCAFPRAEKTTGEAIRVLRNFCRRLSLDWRFAICIGTGPVVVATKGIPFLYRKLKRAYAGIAADIAGNDTGARADVVVKPVIPESVIAMIRRHYERTGEMIEKDSRPRPA